MTMLHRRLLRLEIANRRSSFVHFSDSELDARLRAELAAWLQDDPTPLRSELRADVAAFLAEPSTVPETPT